MTVDLNDLGNVVSTVLPPTLLARLDDECRRSKRDRDAVMRVALELYLAEIVVRMPRRQVVTRGTSTRVEYVDE